MKKLLAILLAAAVLTGGSAAFARDIDSKIKAFDGKDQYRQLINKKDEIRGLDLQHREKVAAIVNKRFVINDLQRQIRDKIKQIKTQINVLKKNKDALDAGKIPALKETLQSLGEASRVLGSTQGAVQRKHFELRTAKQHGNPGLFLQKLDDIIEIQEQRIDALNQILTDLNKLENELK